MGNHSEPTETYSVDTESVRDIPAQEQRWPGSTQQLRPHPDHGEEGYIGRGRLRGKRALITGGDSGIGRAIAITFAKEGADVAIAYLPAEQEDAEDTRGFVETAGRQCALLPCDQRDAQANVDLAAAALEVLGGIDVLVNNAGVGFAVEGGITNYPDGQLEQVFGTNILAPFWLTKAVVAHMRAGASIINTSSIQAFEPSQPQLDYGATKAALNNFTVNLAAELGPRGIRVNAVAPGPIWTPIQPVSHKAADVEGLGKNTPLGRVGQPVEVATAFVYLASDEASYVSGTVLGVTGGMPVF
ncbi:SDR family oxidoreductase [Occultella gossypii]|uniref:SDR family oxidoreductase n=1 Tax=Occultella gossypii TaxID=2800820 RepID=A0ABS7SH65_9MICO|nr:SDR family oxidoreductase [Occultella gossypii]MBZ2199075.1 SDR family oxidoreductase [Occultella gossypii]